MGKVWNFLLVLIGFKLVSIYFTSRTQNNTCKTFSDYLFPEENENCYHDPDLHLEIPEVIERYTTIPETHKVFSEDGYILTLFRIPQKNPKGIILLHHSLGVDSRIYLHQGNKSLAVTLWRNGFEIWLANHRGTSHSDQHINLTKYDYEYWNFYAHEIGYYDISAELKLIRELTNSSEITYIGYSLSGTAALVYSSLKPAEAKMLLKNMIIMAPGFEFSNPHFNNIVLKYIVLTGKLICCLLGIGSPLVFRHYLEPLFKLLSRLFPPVLVVIFFVLSFFCGFSPHELDPAAFNYDSSVYINNFPLKAFYHYVQTSYTGDLRFYDNGEAKNLELYGTTESPRYPIEHINIPTLLITSSHDGLIMEHTSDNLYSNFRAEAKAYDHWKLTGINHIDFIFGLNRKQVFENQLVEFINNSYKYD